MDVMISEDGRLAVRTGYAARDVMKMLPGGRWNKHLSRWTYPMLFPSALALGWAAGKLGEKVIPESQEVVDWVTKQQETWATLTGIGQQLRAEEDVPGWFSHQVQGAKWLSAPGPFGGRMDLGETGSGKTATTLRGLWHVWEQGATAPALVSTLVSVKGGWHNEIVRVAKSLPLTSGEWRPVVLTGSAAARRKQLDWVAQKCAEGDAVGIVVITNHEQLRMHSRLSHFGSIPLARCAKHGGPPESAVTEAKCEAHTKELNFLNWSVCVIDEAHRVMVPAAKVTRAAWYLADSAERTWALTGTPGSRKVVENTWALLRLVMGAEWSSKSSWCGYYAEAGYNSLGFWEVGDLKPEHEEEFRISYDAVTRRVLKAQVLDLPPLLRGGTLVREIPMGKEQAAAYKQMKDKLRADVQNGLLKASSALTQMTRLTGLASACGEIGEVTYSLDNLGNQVEHVEMNMVAPSNKASAIVDMFKSDEIAPGTVFQFVSKKLLYLVRDALMEEGLINLSHMGIIAGDVKEADRVRALENFQSGKIPFFAFTAAAGGTGITLTRANTMVSVQRPWSSIQYMQSQDRVHRIGSERHEAVSIIDLVTPGTVELEQFARLAENAEALEAILKDRDKLLELLS